MKKTSIPSWALKHKKKNMEIHQRGDNFYLCKVSSVWDRKLQRSRKLTGEYLGKITEAGVIPPKYKRVEERYAHISVKEFGATYFLESISGDIIDGLKQVFPYEWKELFTLAVLRLTEKSPLKNISFHYNNSWLSESVKGVRTSQKFLGPFLRECGSRRDLMKKFMHLFVVETDYAVIDVTNIFSYSEGVISAVLGHNKEEAYTPQVNLLLVYSQDKLQPVYFRQVPGSVRDVSTIVRTINEIPADNFVLIGDKGFHSDQNVEELTDNSIDYVFALKRDSKHINYDTLKIGDKKKYDGFFLYNKRHVWFHTKEMGDEQVILYLDPHLKAEEETDLATRITWLEKKAYEKKLDEDEQKQLADYKTRLYDKSHRNGTLSVRTSLMKSGEEVYQIMKSRVNIEQAFDTFKNTLNADQSYMRDDQQLEGWLFINFIAMQMYYKIYALLLEKKLLNNHTPVDVLTHLKRAYTLKIKDDWQPAEIPKKTRELIKKLEIKIPITKNG